MESTVDFKELIDILIKLGIALALGIPIGWERGTGTASIGFRTFPIVAIASCGYIIMAKELNDSSILGNTIQGMLSGIGFIGGGAILKKKGDIQGIVTAASIWNTGAIGMCVGNGNYKIAVVLCIINFLALFLLTPVVKKGYLDPEEGLFNPVTEEEESEPESEKGSSDEDSSDEDEKEKK